MDSVVKNFSRVTSILSSVPRYVRYYLFPIHLPVLILCKFDSKRFPHGEEKSENSVAVFQNKKGIFPFYYDDVDLSPDSGSVYFL